MDNAKKKTPQQQRQYQDLIYIYTVAGLAINGEAPMERALTLIRKRLRSIT